MKPCTTYLRVLGCLVRLLRVRKALTQAEACAKAEARDSGHFWQSTWSRVESGLSPLPLSDLVAVARVLDLSAARLLALTDAATRRISAAGIEVTEDRSWVRSGALAPAALDLWCLETLNEDDAAEGKKP